MPPHYHTAGSASPGNPNLKVILPVVWELIRPRRGLLALGFVLMVINRVCGLVLPFSTRPLIDKVINGHQAGLLK